MLLAQLTDCHVGGADVAALYRLDTRAMLEAAVDRLNALTARPDACLVTGDISENGTPEEYAMARAALDRLAMPWFAIPGNHDQREAFRTTLGTPADGGAFVQYAIDHFPLRIIALDSVIAGRGEGELCEARLAWLDRTLAIAPNRPTLLMLHHPPFPTGQPVIDRMCLTNAMSLAAVVARHPQVEAIVSGHVHRAIHGRLAHASASSCPSTAHQMALALVPRDPVAFTHEPPGFQLHHWPGRGQWTTQTIALGSFAGPFPFH